MYDVKYAPFADSYIGMAHGNGYEHLKHWLKRRLIFCDTLFDYAPSYNNDMLTIRANTTELMNIEIETYTPVYQHVSWYNGQMDKKKIDGKTAVSFSGTAMAETDQEVLIYGGSNIKKISGITSMNPNQMLIGGATRLSELSAPNCPLLADINSNKANLSPHTYLNKVDLSNCPQLGGMLRLNNSQLVRDVNISGTTIDGLQLPTNVRNLEVFKLSEDVANVTLRDAVLLKELNIPTNIEYLSLINVPNLTTITSNASSFEKLNTLIMENPTINPISNITSKAPNLQYVRLTGLNINCATSQIQSLLNMKGVDSFGNEIPLSQAVSGKVTLSQCSEDIEQALKETFPLVEFIVTSYVKSYTVTFVDGDGNTIYVTQTLENGEAIYIGDTPTKTSTAQYHYEWKGWSRQLKPITADTTITATFDSVLRYYTIRFINSDTLEVIDSQYLAYGSMPTKPQLPSQDFNAWQPNLIEPVTKDIDYLTTYLPYPDDLSIFSFNKIKYKNIDGYSCVLLNKSKTIDIEYLIIPFEYNNLPVLIFSQESTTTVNTVTDVYVPDSIMALGTYAFYNFKSITTLNLPNVKSFVYTTGTTVTDGYVCSAINYCDKLKKVILPKVSGIYGIRYSGKYNGLCHTCPSLECVVLGSKEYPFTNFSQSGAYNYYYVHFYASNNIRNILFVTKNGLREDVTFISGGYGFANESRYKFVNEDVSFVETEEYDYQIVGNKATITAYKGTDTEIEIPSTVNEVTITSIDNKVFYSSSVRTEITSVNLPSTVTSLGDNCFQNCSNLTEINISKVTSLGESCFYSCSSLTSINLPLVTSLGNACFRGCTGLTSIELPSVTSLDNNCFNECSNLTSMELPLATSLGDYCFNSCTKLASIELPKVTSLGEYCFQSCSNLKTIVLPKIKTIRMRCFYNTPYTSLTLGGVDSPITDTSGFRSDCLKHNYSTDSTITIYVSDPSNPPTLTGSPWGATNATITYEQA